MDNMNTTDISRAILNGDFTIEQLSEMNSCIKVAWDKAQRNARKSFKVGERVSSGRYGEGMVEKIGPKNLMVRLKSGGLLRASPSALTKV